MTMFSWMFGDKAKKEAAERRKKLERATRSRLMTRKVIPAPRAVPEPTRRNDDDGVETVLLAAALWPSPVEPYSRFAPTESAAESTVTGNGGTFGGAGASGSWADSSSSSSSDSSSSSSDSGSSGGDGGGGGGGGD